MFVLASLAFVQATIVQAQCLERAAFAQASAQLQGVSAGQALTSAQRARLGSALQRLNAGEIAAQLSAHRMSIYAGFLAETLSDLALVQRTGSLQGSGLDALDVAWAAQIFDELCIAQRENIAAEHVGQAKHFLGLITFTFTDAFELGNAPDIRSYINLSLVFFLLLGLISLIVFIWKAYVITVTLLASRKTCKIEAMLRVDGLEIAGHVSLLSTQDVRFIVATQSAEDALLAYLREQETLPKFVLSIRNVNCAAKLHVVSEGHCIALFERALDRGVVQRLFSYSSVPTRLVSKAAVPSNLGAINPKFA